MQLIEEAIALVERRMPDLGRAEARRWFRSRRPILHVPPRLDRETSPECGICPCDFAGVSGA